MKYLKTFNENINSSEIDAICEKYNIKHYTINEDGSIDVDGNVDLSDKYLYELPLNFGKINGNFICNNNYLSSLNGAPQYISGNFECDTNQLTSLKNGPQYVGGFYNCLSNNLSDLNYIANYIGEYINCNMNKIYYLDKFPKCKYIIIAVHNPIFKVLSLFLETKMNVIFPTVDNKFLLNSFNSFDIIINNNLYIDRLVDFLEDIDDIQYNKQELINKLEKEYTIK